jgi:hypothetical protein
VPGRHNVDLEHKSLRKQKRVVLEVGPDQRINRDIDLMR